MILNQSIHTLKVLIQSGSFAEKEKFPITKMIPSNAFREAIKVTARGAATVLASTVTSCALAVVIETGAHRLQYKLFPHWYDGKVKYAMGLPHLQYQLLDSEVPSPIESAKQELEFGQHLEMFTSAENDASVWRAEDKLEQEESHSVFQNYQEKLQDKAQLMNPERVSKILLTTAMTG